MSTFEKAEALFKAATTKPVEGPPKDKAHVIPSGKETVSLRLDRDVHRALPGRRPGLAGPHQRRAAQGRRARVAPAAIAARARPARSPTAALSAHPASPAGRVSVPVKKQCVSSPMRHGRHHRLAPRRVAVHHRHPVLPLRLEKRRADPDQVLVGLPVERDARAGCRRGRRTSRAGTAATGSALRNARCSRRHAVAEHRDAAPGRRSARSSIGVDVDAVGLDGLRAALDQPPAVLDRVAEVVEHRLLRGCRRARSAASPPAGASAGGRSPRHDRARGRHSRRA